MAFQFGAFQAAAFQAVSDVVKRFLPSSGNRAKHPERWQDHVPSFIAKERAEDKLRLQQQRNLAILSLAL